jgi:hypothetical protein
MDMDLLLRPVRIHETYMEELNLKADDLQFIWKVRDMDHYESLPMFSWEQISLDSSEVPACEQAVDPPTTSDANGRLMFF